MNKSSVVQMFDVLEMVGFLKTNGTQCRFVSMVSYTAVTNLRANCPYKNVKKVARKIGLINANYNTSVRRRIAERLGVNLSEVEYENGNVWYQHVMTKDGKALPLCVNKKTPNNGKYYIQYFPHKSTHKYLLPNGEEVAESLLKPYFYAESERDFKPTVIVVGLENVRQLKASGVVIEMPELAEAEAILAD